MDPDYIVPCTNSYVIMIGVFLLVHKKIDQVIICIIIATDIV